jgi:hypothetical protein
MARNDIPRNASQVIGLGNKMREGLDKWGTELGITQITPAGFQAELNAFSSAYSDFNAARSARQTASDVSKTADATLSEWLQITRNVLAGRFGNRWSTMWAQAGFINPSTKVPTRIEERLGLALSLATFFTANPSYEVKSMDVTAEKATALRKTALTAQDALATADVDLKTKGEVYDVAFIALTDTMRALIKILTFSLDREDPRWLAFGLQMPATDTTPGQPVNVTAQLDEVGNIIVQCDPVPLATRYRWRMFVVGVETDYRLVARSTEPIGIIVGVQPGQRAQIIVQAVNNNMQGVASDPIIFSVTVGAQIKAKGKAPAATELTGLAVNEEAMAAATDGGKSRSKENRLPTLT